MKITEIGIKELIKAVKNENSIDMSEKYRLMLKDFGAYVYLELNSNSETFPITLFNKVSNIQARLDLINEYRKYMEFCWGLELIIDGET